MLKKRSVSLSGHATSVALEPAFWAVLDQVAAAAGLSQAGLMKRIDERRGRTPLASACRLPAQARASRRRPVFRRTGVRRLTAARVGASSGPEGVTWPMKN
ncbi:MAG TPA: ribbon-helix-helix domain-containing protein [Brevundimonas sp.]|nr:ribbon-helix-helix domain-containing protein [Brevundimonas sp.]